MEIDTSKLTDEQISKLGEFIHSMEKENDKITKWWIMPKYGVFSKEVQEFGQSYVVEPQEDTYSRNRPPLKSGFGSKEAAEKWLTGYLKERALFTPAISDLNNFISNLNIIKEKLQNFENISNDDWHNCFISFNASLNCGSLSKVTG